MMPTRSKPGSVRRLLGLAAILVSIGCREPEARAADPAVDLTTRAAPADLVDSTWRQWQRRADRSRVNACALLATAAPDARREIDSVARSLGAWPQSATPRYRDSLCAALRVSGSAAQPNAP